MERLWRSIKHEDVYLKGYATVPEVQMGLKEYFVFYNTERTHQSLDYSTPDVIYQTASGGGARIVDKFKEKNIVSANKQAQPAGLPSREARQPNTEEGNDNNQREIWRSSLSIIRNPDSYNGGLPPNPQDLSLCGQKYE